MGKVVFTDAKNVAARLGQRRNDLHIFQGNGIQQLGQGLAARQHFDNRQCAQCALVLRQVKRLNGLQVAGHQANAGLAIGYVSNNFH